MSKAKKGKGVDSVFDPIAVALYCPYLNFGYNLALHLD